MTAASELDEETALACPGCGARDWLACGCGALWCSACGWRPPEPMDGPEVAVRDVLGVVRGRLRTSSRAAAEQWSSGYWRR